MIVRNKYLAVTIELSRLLLLIAYALSFSLISAISYSQNRDVHLTFPDFNLIDTTSRVVSVISYGAKSAGNLGEAAKYAKINAEAIQTAITRNPGKRILIPAGYYVIGAPIIINSGIEIIGEGKGNTILQAYNSDCFHISSNDVSIKDMYLQGGRDLGSSKAYCGVNVYSFGKKLSFLTFTNLQIISFATAIELNKSWCVRMENIDFQINSNLPQIEVAIKVVGQSVNNFITGCHILSNGIGIWSKADTGKGEVNPEGLIISNSLISMAKHAILVENTLSVHVSNCILDLASGIAVYIKQSKGVLLSNNWIYSSNSSPTDQSIQLEGAIDCNISNNNMKTMTGNKAIGASAFSNNITITGNTVELGNPKGILAEFDRSTARIIFKNNSLKRKRLPLKSNQPFIKAAGLKSIINDNITSYY